MLTNSQYGIISRIYDDKQNRARRLKEERQREIKEKFPVLSEIDERIIEGSIKAAKLAFAGNDDAITNLRKSNEYLISQKKAILKDNGYPSDYLDNVYECAVCKDTGRTDSGRCRCYLRTIIETFYIDENRRRRLEVENFQNFNPDYYDNTVRDEVTGLTDNEIMEDSVNKALDFVENFGKEYTNLLISGNAGTGKTFLANCITKGLYDNGVLVLYLPAFQFFKIEQEAKFGDDEEKQKAIEMLDFIYDSECLIIDDLGSELGSAFINAQLFECMEERALRRKPTVFTTNLTKENIGDRYSERIRSRLLSDYKYLKMPGKDNRARG